MNKEELIDWIDRSPSNSDLDTINYIISLQQENERLNNIINELEKYLEKQQREQGEYCDFFIKDKQIEVQEILYKLKELKEENK